MSWVVAGVAAASLAANVMNSNEQRQQRKSEMLANAAQQQYSPWTGMKSGMVGYSGTPTQTGSAAQGALAGAMQGMAIKKAINSTPSQPTTELPKTQGTGQGQAANGNPYAPGTAEYNQWEQTMNTPSPTATT